VGGAGCATYPSIVLDSTTYKFRSETSFTPTRRGGSKKRQPNYRGRSTCATLAKQAAIRELLTTGLPLTVRAVGDALGISRQLALYHIKKMAATGQLVLMLEPCPANGGLQFCAWSEAALMDHYMRMGQRVRGHRAA